ncbi:hypothetical protein F5Y15DRAFT_422824 [Xylariaceae sp. FL0016]|nr:hypothetical protein F5Y15DRAFT_422824 [Xylariaceae sp. FL0016]
MVNRRWSPEEERYFWLRVIPNSQKRLGADQAREERSWDALAATMQRDMAQQGIRRRTYTPQMLYEHFHQNVEQSRVSPNASQYVFRYKQRRGDITSTGAPGPGRRTTPFPGTQVKGRKRKGAAGAKPATEEEIDEDEKAIGERIRRPRLESSSPARPGIALHGHPAPNVGTGRVSSGSEPGAPYQLQPRLDFEHHRWQSGTTTGGPSSPRPAMLSQQGHIVSDRWDPFRNRLPRRPSPHPRGQISETGPQEAHGRSRYPNPEPVVPPQPRQYEYHGGSRRPTSQYGMPDPWSFPPNYPSQFGHYGNYQWRPSQGGLADPSPSIPPPPYQFGIHDGRAPEISRTTPSHRFDSSGWSSDYYGHLPGSFPPVPQQHPAPYSQQTYPPYDTATPPNVNSPAAPLGRPLQNPGSFGEVRYSPVDQGQYQWPRYSGSDSDQPAPGPLPSHPAPHMPSYDAFGRHGHQSISIPPLSGSPAQQLPMNPLDLTGGIPSGTAWGSDQRPGEPVGDEQQEQQPDLQPDQRPEQGRDDENDDGLFCDSDRVEYDSNLAWEEDDPDYQP